MRPLYSDPSRPVTVGRWLVVPFFRGRHRKSPKPPLDDRVHRRKLFRAPFP